LLIDAGSAADGERRYRKTRLFRVADAVVGSFSAARARAIRSAAARR
jgi:hypothetical protein